jgi:hypothetical protein
VMESLVGVGFVALAVVGFRTSLWLVGVALGAHGVFDLVHGAVVSNPGVPLWWPSFCLTYDVSAAAYLAWLIISRRIQSAAWTGVGSATGGCMSRDETVLQTMPVLVRALMIVFPVLLCGGLLWTWVEGGIGVSAALQRLGPFIIIALSIGFITYRVAHTVVLHETAATLEFRTFLGARVVPAREITSISSSFFQRSQLVIKHASGSVSVPAQFEGCHDLIEWIRTHNPRVVLKGI